MMLPLGTQQSGIILSQGVSAEVPHQNVTLAIK